jgi:acetyltransferase
LDLGDLFDLNLYAQIVEQTLQLENVDGVVFLHTSLSEKENIASRELLERIMGLVEKHKKPVAYYISTGAQELSYLKQNYHFPIFTQVVETIRALEMSNHYYCQSQMVHSDEAIPTFDVNRQAVRSLVDHARSESRDLLLSEALQVLEHYGIPTARSVVALNVDEAISAAEAIGYPVAIKIISEQISHKSDVGGVQLNLRNPAALSTAFEDMMERITKAYPDVKIDGVIVQPMVTGGRELILGGRQDPHFGPVVLVGLGGIFVEIFEEVVLRVVPITPREAMRMIENLRGYQILQGARGHKRSDIEAVVDTVLRLSQLLVDFPEIKELDINPLRVFHEAEGCRALDARMIIG